MQTLPKITVSSFDLSRLESLISGLPDEQAEQLEALLDELHRAEVVEPQDIPKNVVTMNSRIRYVIEGTNEVREATLSFPKDVHGAEDRISILAPVGSALIGLSVGQSIEWKLPNGRVRRIRLEEILYQPEHQGDYTA